MRKPIVPCFFHRGQLSFRPRYEWALGKRIQHPERTKRADKILAAIEHESERYEMRQPAWRPIDEIERQHHPDMLRLYETATELEEGKTYYPSVFLQRHTLDVDPSLIHHVGHWCFDSGTPLAAETWLAATWSAGCAWHAAKALREERHAMVYALSRPPGHHAANDLFGGYCYLNNSALAASLLRQDGRVVVLDIDVHHGNGTQGIFWRDDQVLTVSIHGDPRTTFPYFLGFENETGEGPGKGCNVNVPLPSGTDGKEYMRVLKEKVLPLVKSFEPEYVVLAAGLDAYELDPVGDFRLTTDDFREIGERIGALKLPLCAVQEGGYYTPHIGVNALALLDGMRETCHD